jgi:excisionase family DNA binding protein
MQTSPERTFPLAYSVADAVKVSSIGRTKLYALIGAQKLEIVKIGKRTLIKADSLHRLLETGA